MSSPINKKTLVKAAVVASALAAAWYFFAPAQLGGRTSFVITYGTSMQPVYHAGDLAIIRQDSSYHVGEIVAYKNMSLGGATVLHRIIGIQDGHYTFKGDNNNFIDSYHPTANQLVGKLWFHVPSAGKYLLLIHGPRMFLLGGLLSLLTLGGIAGTQRTRMRRGRKVEVPEIAGGSRMSSKHSVGTFPLAALGALVLFGALAAASYTRPVTKAGVAQNVYSQNAHFSYTAQATGNSRVYQGTSISTGQPLFLNLVREAEFKFSYDFYSKAAHQVFGQASLNATLSAPDGWTRTIVLAAPTAFSGNRVTVGGTLDIASLKTLLAQVAKVTDVTGGTYTLTLAPKVQVGGTIGGHALRDSFAPTLPFLVDAYQLQLQPGSAAGAGSTAMLTQSTAGSAPIVIANTITLPKLKLHVAFARKAALAGAGASALALVLALGFALRRKPRTEVEEIERNYGELIVDVTETPRGLELPTVTVGSIDGLVRIAEQAARMILHLHHEDIDVYFIEDNGFVYTYQVQNEPAIAPSEVPAEPLTDATPIAALNLIQRR